MDTIYSAVRLEDLRQLECKRLSILHAKLVGRVVRGKIGSLESVTQELEVSVGHDRQREGTVRGFEDLVGGKKGACSSGPLRLSIGGESDGIPSRLDRHRSVSERDVDTPAATRGLRQSRRDG